ncbi:GntR family transcriptional regulator [Oscillospiraceae bacterium PP1C4]
MQARNDRLEKLNNKQTKDRIATMLRQEILSGRIADGEELVQEQLAEKLEVSRMPVREAIQILELEGLLIRLPNRHMQVVGLREDTVWENLRILAAIESEIALILAQSGKDISTLNTSDEREFHSMLSALTGNHYICQTHRRLLEGYPQYIWENIADKPDAHKMQQAILTAIQAANETAIFQSVRQYYQSLADTLISYIREAHINE